jgi:hypothetical protein
MPSDERAPRLTLEARAVDRVLQTGEIEILGLLPRSSNYTFLARVTGSDGELLAVYKPRRGESPLWDFPEGTLGRREVAAFVVARELGWPAVPTTVFRDGPEGPGSLQRFVEFDPGEHYFTLIQGREDVFRRIALFDAVVNNADRKGGHTLLSMSGEVFVIDHGVCFHAQPKLRTVIWEFAGERVGEPLLADLDRLRGAMAEGAPREELDALLRPGEVTAFERRVDGILLDPRFPEPGDGRPYPWPAI